MEGSRKKYLLYIAYLILFILASAVLKQVKLLSPATSSLYAPLSLTLHVIAEFLLYATCGAILGIEHFIKERKKEGAWSVKTSKLLILCIPALIVGLYPLIYYVILPFSFMPELTGRPFWDFTALAILMRILLGYAVITSIYKKGQES